MPLQLGFARDEHCRRGAGRRAGRSRQRRPGAASAAPGCASASFPGCEPDSLRFCLEALVSGTDLEPLAFDFELLPGRAVPAAAAQTFRVVEYQPACPACGSHDTEAAGGDEMELSYLELEEP